MTNIELFKKILYTCAISVVDYTNYDEYEDEYDHTIYAFFDKLIDIGINPDSGSYKTSSYASHYFGSGISGQYWFSVNSYKDKVLMTAKTLHHNKLSLDEFQILYDTLYLNSNDKLDLTELMNKFKNQNWYEQQGDM